jgi:hypothetical protein
VSDSELLTLWLGAFRYYLRQQTPGHTTHCSAFTDILKSQWDVLPAAIHEAIAAELRTAFAQDASLRANPDQIIAQLPLGADCHRHCWEELMEMCSHE